MQLKELLTGFREAVKVKFDVRRFSVATFAKILNVDAERYTKWEKGFNPNSESDRQKIKSFFGIDSLENIPNSALKNTLSRLELPSDDNDWINTGSGKVFITNGTNNYVSKINKSVGNIANDLLISISPLQKHFSETLPFENNSNGWSTYMENVSDLKNAIYRGDIKNKNLMLMESKPQNLIRIPDILSDFSFDMFSRNMMPRFNPGDRLDASYIDMEDVMFGYAYYIVFINRRLPATVNYIRKTRNNSMWLLDNEDKVNFDDKEIQIEKIHSIYTITYAGEKITQ
jgi:hypothetical protein